MTRTRLVGIALLGIIAVLPHSVADDDEPGPNDIIVDNADKRAKLTGAWRIKAARAAHRYGADFAFIAGGSKATAKFRPAIPATDQYHVYIRYVTLPASSRSVSVDIHHADGTVTRTINQKMSSGKWVPLGRYRFRYGRDGYVTIKAADARGLVVADAVRFVPLLVLVENRGTRPVETPAPAKAPETADEPGDTPGATSSPARTPVQFSESEIVAAARSTGDKWAAKVRGDISGSLRLIETDHFLIYTALDTTDDGLLRSECERFHDRLAETFSIPQGRKLWQGKLIVFAFRRGDAFVEFAKTIHGAYSAETDMDEMTSYIMPLNFGGGGGTITTYCITLTYQIAKSSAAIPTHESFLANLASDLVQVVQLSDPTGGAPPSWMHEGLSDYLASTFVSGCPQAQRRARAAAAAIRQGHNVMAVFQRTGPLQVVRRGIDERGVAQSLVRFLYLRDKDAFFRYYGLLKEGKADADALQETFELTHKGLVKLWRAEPAG
ncbi:hypothetical protein LCGC14_0017860 [marine sediment metagenome]|uniref:Golvesin/Xly CBD-like domain-containing protein n=1 Tax=marine sediment metagenome TaxID=412755 RepID=A0A0F9W208_9ZZZZ|nr:hypothetical protein [Phycisphaerae bacterium]